MKKNTWKTIALSALGVATASVVVIFKLLEEIDDINSTNTSLLKEMADEGLIENLTIGGKPYVVED